jgi:hypothetical protein
MVKPLRSLVPATRASDDNDTLTLEGCGSGILGLARSLIRARVQAAVYRFSDAMLPNLRNTSPTRPHRPPWVAPTLERASTAAEARGFELQASGLRLEA